MPDRKQLFIRGGPLPPRRNNNAPSLQVVLVVGLLAIAAPASAQNDELGGACGEPADCNPGESCLSSGICGACTDDRSCMIGVCSAGNGICQVGCSLDSDCDPTRVCLAAACVVPEGGACSADEECAKLGVCKAGACLDYSDEARRYIEASQMRGCNTSGAEGGVTIALLAVALLALLLFRARLGSS